MSIKIDLKIFLLGVLFFLTNQIKVYMILLLFAFLHEIGHLLLGLVVGFQPKTIRVNPLGFQITFQSKQLKKKNFHFRKILVLLAGPMVNLWIAGICCLVRENLFIQKEVLIYSNLLLAIFNMLPIYPLDGGRILKEFLHIQRGKQEAHRIVGIISKSTVIAITIMVSILILYVHNIAFLFVLVYLWYFVWNNQKEYQIYERTLESIHTIEEKEGAFDKKRKT